MAKRVFDREYWFNDNLYADTIEQRVRFYGDVDKTCKQWWNIWTRNINENAAAGRIAPEYSIVTDYGTQDGPVLIVGAGPSFSDNLDLIRGLSESVKIIAVDRTLKPLKQMGINPFLTVSLDAQPEALRFFTGVKIMESDHFALSVITHPSIWDYVEARTQNIRYHGHINPFASWWNLAAKRFGDHICTTSSGSVVLHNAVDIAYWMGFDAIYTIGNDLCYRTIKEAKEDTGGYEVIKIDGRQTIHAFERAAHGFASYRHLHPDVELVDFSGGIDRGWPTMHPKILMNLVA